GAGGGGVGWGGMGDEVGWGEGLDAGISRGVLQQLSDRGGLSGAVGSDYPAGRQLTRTRRARSGRGLHAAAPDHDEGVALGGGSRAPGSGAVVVAVARDEGPNDADLFAHAGQLPPTVPLRLA